MGTHLKITTDECTTQELALDDVFSTFSQAFVQVRNFFLFML